MIVKLNFSTGEWTISEKTINENFFEVFIGFIESNKNEKVCHFENLGFGFTVIENSKNVSEFSWPLEKNIKYLETNQEYLESAIFFNVKEGKEYKLFFWVKNDEAFFEKEFLLTNSYYEKTEDIPEEVLIQQYLSLIEEGFTPEEASLKIPNLPDNF